MTDLEAKIDKYKVLKKLKEGSSAVVYLVEDAGELYALKIIKDKSAEAVARFRRESSTLGRIRQQNLVKVYDSGVWQDSAFIVMEFLKGKSLEEEIQSAKQMDPERSVWIIKSVLNALSELHKQNFIHRDIKPANIMVTDDGKVYLIDLGLVGEISDIKGETSLVGTPMYCSPEQSRVLKREVDFRSDLYSVGATLFNMLVGRPPFIGSFSEILRLNASQPAPSVLEFNHQVPFALVRIIAKLLAKDPDDRYQSAFGLISDLDALEALNSSGTELILGVQDRATQTNKVKYIHRKLETENLTQAWTDVKNKKSQFAMVKGVSGSGKSRFCNEFLSQPEFEKSIILRAKCQNFDRALPLKPFREVLEFLIVFVNSLPSSERKIYTEKIQKAGFGLESSLVEIYSNLNQFFPGIEVSELELGNSESDSEIFYNNISDFFINLCKNFDSLVFFIDDIHWLDIASANLFKNIFKKSKDCKILLISTARSDQESQRFLAEINEKAEFAPQITIFMNEFSRDQFDLLVHQFLGHTIEQKIYEQIFRLSGGNLFVGIEYLRSSAEQGFIFLKDKEWKLNEIEFEKIRLSDDILNLMVKRIEKISSKAEIFFQIAALVGNSFDSFDIAHVAEIKKNDLDAILDQASELALIEKFFSNRWKFVHDKIPEAMVKSQSQEKKEANVNKLIQLYFQKNGKSVDEIFLLARLTAGSFNFSKSEQAIESYSEAGALALANYSYREGYWFYKLAFDCIKFISSEQSPKVSFAAQLAVCATMIDDESVAISAINIHLAQSQGKGLVKALGLKTWVLANLSDYVGACENFKLAEKLKNNFYPTYLHMQLLQLVCIWAYTIILDVFPSPILFLKSKKNKNLMAEESSIINMYRTIQTCYELRRSAIDFALISMKMLLRGLKTGSSKDKALGYASIGYLYGMFGLKKMSLSYAEKADVESLRAQDPSVTAYCEFRKILGLFYCGLEHDFFNKFQEKREFLERFLPPLEFGRLITTLTGYLGTAGFHVDTIEQLVKNVTSYNNKSLRLTKSQHTLQLANLQMQFFLVGQSKEAQKIRSAQLKLSNEMRNNANSFRNALTAELSIQRHTEELESDVDDSIRSYNARGRALGDPNGNYFSLNTAFIRLIQLERAKTEEERLSLKNQINIILRKSSITLFCPLFRSNHYLVKGIYFRILGKFEKAEKNFKLAETLALKSKHLIVLFDIQRNRAKIYLNRNEIERAKMSLAWPLSIVDEQKWTSRKRLLQKEFGKYLLFQDSQSDVIEGSVSQTQQYQSKPVYETGGATASASKSTVAGGISGSGVRLDEIRFVDAILNVSNAFTISVDPEEQAKAVLARIIKLFAAERGFLFEVNEKQDENRLISAKDSEGLELSANRTFSATILRKVISERKALIIANTEEAKVLGSESAVLHNIRSIIAAPLIINEQLSGVVYLDSSLMRGLFAESDLSLFTTLINHISVTFELARMKRIEEEKRKLQLDLDIQSAIASESKKVKILVDSMKQGLFSITGDGTIVDPVSKFTEKVLGKNVVGQNFKDTLYKDIPANSEIMNAIETAVTSVFGESDLQWDLMESNFPKKINYSHEADGSSKKIIKIQPSPIWNQEENLERILFVVEDITELDGLEVQLKEQKRSAQITEELIQYETHDIGNFLKMTELQLENWKHLAIAGANLSKNELLRDLHSLKGTTRSYKLAELSDQIHRSESVILGEATSDPNRFDDLRSLSDEISKISDKHSDYYKRFKKLYAGANNDLGTNQINELAHQELEKLVFQLRSDLPENKFLGLQDAVQQLHFKPLSSLSNRLSKMVEDISGQLNKKVNLEVVGDALVQSQLMSQINECIIHLLRNSIDHGIESIDERVKNKKQENGNIKISFRKQNNEIIIQLSDDGKGMDAEKIAESALKKGLISFEQSQKFSKQEKLDLIFTPQFSTKASADDISGRGIGMDSVKNTVESLGGTLIFNTVLGQGTQFSITLKSVRKILAA